MDILGMLSRFIVIRSLTRVYLERQLIEPQMFLNLFYLLTNAGAETTILDCAAHGSLFRVSIRFNASNVTSIATLGRRVTGVTVTLY